METLLYLFVAVAAWLGGWGFAQRRAAERRYRDDLEAYNQRRFPYNRQAQLPDCRTAATCTPPTKDSDHE